jgi:hypothetical protein
MKIQAAFILFIICTACQSGRIPCPEIEFAKIKESKAGKGNRFFAPPSRMMASAKTMNGKSSARNQVDLERLKASRTSGKEMLEQYGSVEEWDCPNPSEKKKYSRITRENIRRNEKKMREQVKRVEADSLSLIPAKRYK